ncbi:MAG: hypothetical protein HRF49_10955 [bacterium]|jgi:hypothetical protein
MTRKRIPDSGGGLAGLHEPNGSKKLLKVFDPADIPDAPDILESSICLTCSHRDTCLFLGAARLPIYQCDEFTDSSLKRDNP